MITVGIFLKWKRDNWNEMAVKNSCSRNAYLNVPKMYQENGNSKRNFLSQFV